MKKQTILMGAMLLTLLKTQAAIDYTVGAIPDAPNGGIVGVSFTATVSGVPLGYDIISGVSLTLNISGGYNNDLYAYLAAPNGTLVTLFNQPGSVYTSGSGFNVTLSDSFANSIQTASQTENAALTGNYQALGSLGAFNGGTANGVWTLYFQDLSPGANSTLDGWSLDITAVPEPVNVALGIVGVVGAAGWLVKWRRKAKAEMLTA